MKQPDEGRRLDTSQHKTHKRRLSQYLAAHPEVKIQMESTTMKKTSLPIGFTYRLLQEIEHLRDSGTRRFYAQQLAHILRSAPDITEQNVAEGLECLAHAEFLTVSGTVRCGHGHALWRSQDLDKARRMAETLENCHSCGEPPMEEIILEYELAGLPPERTTISEIPAPYLRALRATVSRALPNLSFRHAGLGVLQAYLYEGVKNEMRVHIWHPDLKKPGMVDHGDVHDHRFGLRSYVLAGAVCQEEFEMEPDERGTWRCHAVTHAREAAEKTGTHHDVKDGESYGNVERTHQHIVRAGSVYEFPKRAFHRSSVEGLTVTLVEKLDQDEVPARILSLRDAPIVHAFTDVLDEEAIRPYVEEAQKMLLRLASAENA